MSMCISICTNRGLFLVPNAPASDQRQMGYRARAIDVQRVFAANSRRLENYQARPMLFLDFRLDCCGALLVTPRPFTNQCNIRFGQFGIWMHELVVKNGHLAFGNFFADFRQIFLLRPYLVGAPF